MSIRVLAFVLLAGASLALAAPPKSSMPKDAPPSDSGQTAETIDVDALARAKDADAAAEAAAAAAEAPPAADAPPSETPPADEAAIPAPTTAETSEAPVAASEPAPAVNAADAPPTAETAATAPSAADVEAKSIAAACASRAVALLDAAEKADYGNATRDFDAKMRSSLPTAKFKEQWEVLSQFGKLEARGQSHLGKGDGYTIVQIPLIFQKTNLVAQIACGSDGRIAGFHVNQAPTPKF